MAEFERGMLVTGPHRRGVICRFIGGNPVVAWEGDNLITMHAPEELTRIQSR